MKNLFAFLLFLSVVFIYTSCNRVDRRTHFTYYFIENKTGSPIKVNATLITPETDYYCNNCIIDDNQVSQLATNNTTIGDTPPNETFRSINIYRNDSLKVQYIDSSMLNLVWDKVIQTETVTDYKLVITHL